MVSFVVYDLLFLAVFAIVAFLLLHRNRKNLKRHGWIFLYHSKFGIKFIEWVSKKFERVLRPLQYLVIASGYILMTGILWILGLSVWRYVTSPIPEQLQNVPPIAPLIPYFPKLFNLDSFFPPLYFTYFLIALAIVAVSHEFAHGIFARLNKIKVKTTGLAFFGPFFGAFVEPDEKQMEKSSKFSQLSILGAGTFANVVMTLLFLIILWGFFSVSFVPAGINFNTYPQAVVDLDSLNSINGVSVSDVGNIEEVVKEGLNEIEAGGVLYLIPSESLLQVYGSDVERIVVFEDAPAIRNGFEGPILEIDGKRVASPEGLREILSEYSPGDEIEILTLGEESNKRTVMIGLGEREGEAYLGVGFVKGNTGFVTSMFSTIQKIRDPLVYYEPVWDGEFVEFIYDLLWWIIVINILVALFNMLPLSILDGGRFFYITIWGITKSQKFGKKAFSFMTWAILAVLVIMMVRWVIGLV